MTRHDVNEARAFAYALAAVALWSTVASGFKLGLAHLTPLQLLWLGACVSTLLFWGIQLWDAVRRRFVRPMLREWVEAAWIGALNPLLYYLVLFEAYARLPAQVAQPLNYTWAIALAVLAVPVLKQRLGSRRILGILVSYGGVVLLLQGPGDTNPGAAAHNLDPTGVVLALASTLIWATYWLFNTRSSTPPVRLLSLSFLIAIVPLTALCAAGPGLPAPTLEHLGFGLWVGLIEMGFTFLLWQRALRRTRNAALIGQLIFLSPFLSLFLINCLLGETIHPTSIAGLTVIVAGLLVSGGAPATPPNGDPPNGDNAQRGQARSTPNGDRHDPGPSSIQRAFVTGQARSVITGHVITGQARSALVGALVASRLWGQARSEVMDQ